MSRQALHAVPQSATYGYLEESGAWTIEVGIPGQCSVVALNRFALDCVTAFRTAFRALCRVDEVSLETAALPAAVADSTVAWDPAAHLVPDSGDPVVADLALSLGEDGLRYPSAIFLHCSTLVLPAQDVAVLPTWLPKSSNFYFGYVLEPDANDHLIPTDGAVEVSVATDPWVERTYDPLRLEWRDNRAYATANRSLLEEALRAWEALMGKTITEWRSRYYRDQIFRYGFVDATDHLQAPPPSRRDPQA